MTAALDDVLSGQGRVVVLAGEPGIGKTRALEEFAAHAEAVGVQVLWGRCPEERGAPPYWPWIQIIRAYVAARDANTLYAEMGCIFHGKVATDSTRKLPLIPRQSCRQFHAKVAIDSTAKLPPHRIIS
jgi:hypothetical protein